MNDSVVLDPAVELFDTGESGWALCHGVLCTGLVVPPGEGLLELLRELTQPRAMSTLAEEYGDSELVEAIVGGLLSRGFAHRVGEDLRESRERARCKAGLRDTITVDLDMPGALALLRKILGSDLAADEKRWLILDADAVLGLDLHRAWDATADEAGAAPPDVRELLRQRDVARAGRDFATADRLRDQLGELGWDVVDAADGSTLKARS